MTPFSKMRRTLVHPIGGEPMLFDVRGEAISRDCGTRWRRSLNVVKLVE
jgi:hypothetical protein